MPHSRFCTFFALFCAVLLPSPATAAGSATNPAVITALAAEAYVWGLGPEFIERFSKYNTIIGAPFNALKYGSVPAAWNNDGTNAGDASVLYISGFADFDQSPELVLTVPPSRDQYYVVGYYDAYGNSIGSIGKRTTPSDAMVSYLLVGPKSPYANKQTAKIHGYDYPVMASDTNVNWFLIRVLTNTLIDASDSTSVTSIYNGVVKKFALNTLQEFEQNGHQPVYPASFILQPPTPEQLSKAAPYQNAPTDAVVFFDQLGTAVAANPIPSRDTALSGTALNDLPAWIVPQYGARTIYLVPSYGQKRTLDSFAPLGLTEKGFSIPGDWGNAQLQALQYGYELGQQILQQFIAGANAGASTNYWGILNDIVGTYPNNALGYLYRSLIVVEGGVANIALDAVYPTVVGNPMPFDGNHTYKVTFTVPSSNPTLPVAGIYPPMVSDSSGNPKGFWSIHVYATDPTQSAAPFIAQTSVLNTSYSTADTAVLSVDAATNSMTVSAPTWGTLVESTPILFGGDATAYGLTPNTVYYVASAPTPNADQTTYTFQISALPLSKTLIDLLTTVVCAYCFAFDLTLSFLDCMPGIVFRVTFVGSAIIGDSSHDFFGVVAASKGTLGVGPITFRLAQMAARGGLFASEFVMAGCILGVGFQLEIAWIIRLRRFGAGLHVEIGLIFLVRKTWESQHTGCVACGGIPVEFPHQRLI